MSSHITRSMPPRVFRPASIECCYTGFHHFLRDAEHASLVGTMQRQVADRQRQEFRELARRAQFFVVLPDMKTTLHDEKLIKKQLSVCEPSHEAHDVLSNLFDLFAFAC